MTFTERAGDALRQGDICVIPGLPVWNISTAKTVHDAQGLLSEFVLGPHAGVQWDELTGEIAVAVCSHDCDIENPRTRTGLLVAPLVKVPARLGTAEHAKIMRSDDTSLPLDYINLFPVSVGTGNEAVDAVIDFSAVVSIAKAEKARDFLAAAKRYELDNATRESFRKKLALFLTRPYQQSRESS